MNRLKPNFVVKEEEGLRVHIEGEEGAILEYDVNDGVRIVDANNTPRIEFIDTEQDKRVEYSVSLDRSQLEEVLDSCHHVDEVRVGESSLLEIATNPELSDEEFVDTLDECQGDDSFKVITSEQVAEYSTVDKAAKIVGFNPGIDVTKETSHTAKRIS